MAKKRVVVLYGGRADEHSISCISTAGVLGAMDAERFEPIPVGITKGRQVDHQWRRSAWLELGRRRAADRKDHPGIAPGDA